MHTMLYTVTDAKCWFVKLWSSLELFGMEFLSCTNTESKENGLIGVSKDRVSHSCTTVYAQYMCMMKYWRHNKQGKATQQHHLRWLTFSPFQRKSELPQVGFEPTSLFL